MFRSVSFLFIFWFLLIPSSAQTNLNNTQVNKGTKTTAISEQSANGDSVSAPIKQPEEAPAGLKRNISKQKIWVKDIMGLMEREKIDDSLNADYKDTVKSPYEIMKEKRRSAIPLLIMRPASGFGVSKLKNKWLLYLCESYMYFKLGGNSVLHIISQDTLSKLLAGYKVYSSAIDKEQYREVARALSVPYLLYLQCEKVGKNVAFLGGISSVINNKSFANIAIKFPLKELAATLDRYAVQIINEMGIEPARQNRTFLDMPLASTKAKNLKKLGQYIVTAEETNMVDKVLWDEFIKKYNILLKKDSKMLVGYYAAINFCEEAEQYIEAARYSHDLVHKLGQKYPPAYVAATKFYRLIKKFDMAIQVADQAKNLNEIRDPLQKQVALCEKEREIELARLAAEAKKAEERRREEEARKAEERRRAEEARKAEEARRAEEARKAAEARKAESERRVREAQKAAEARRAEKQRRIEEQQLAEEMRRAEEERIAEEARIAREEESVAPAAEPEPELALVEKPLVTPAIYPDDVPQRKTGQSPMIQKGKNLVKQKKYKKAISVFQEVIEDGKTTSEMLFWLFRAYLYSGNIEEGERAFLDNIIDPNSPWSLIIQSEIDESRSFFSEAWKKYNMVLEKDPDNQYAIAGIGRIELLRENYESAMESFSKAYALNQDNTEYLFNLGKCYEGMNQDENALGIYEEVLSSTPDHTEALKSAERLRKKLGMQEKTDQNRIAEEEAQREAEIHEAEKTRKMEEARREEQERIAKEKAMKSEEERRAKESRRAEKERRAEEERIARERAEEEARRAEQQKKEEEERIAREKALMAEEEQRSAERAGDMEETDLTESEEPEDGMESIFEEKTVSIDDELKKLVELRDKGVISEEDFQEFKKQLLSQ